jgi:diguanylate cyclase (GGDEF)-like protein
MLQANDRARLLAEDLAPLRIFEGVELSCLEHVAAVSAVSSLRRGTLLFDLDQSNDQVFVVLEGMLAVHLHLEAQPIAVIGRGEIAGEVAVLGEQGTSAYVRADTDCELLALGRQTLWWLFDESHDFARNLIRVFPRRLAELHRVIRSVQQLHDEYRQHATTDPLTGLYNRRWLDESLGFEVSRCQLRERPLCLLMIDIDHFKPYNDSHGHMAGDAALRAVARAVLTGLRGSDLAVRFGGEEILVILPGLDLAGAGQVAERLHEAIAGETIEAHGGRRLPAVTVSIGVSEMRPDDSSDALVERADAALYRAKAAGRNRTAR